MKFIISWLALEKGHPVPKHYRHSYCDFFRAWEIYYPVPINYIVRYWRKYYWAFLKFFYWMGLIDKGANEEFRWGDFFKIKSHQSLIGLLEGLISFMRCKNCGGFPQHFITDISGKCFYRCSTTLTRFRMVDGVLLRDCDIYPCDAICDLWGHLANGFIAYNSGGKTQTVLTLNGKLQNTQGLNV